MKRAVVIVFILIAAGAAVTGAWWYVNQNPQLRSLVEKELDAAMEELGLRSEAPLPGLVASGFVEADEAAVTTELGGRIVALHADEGDEVSLGMPLVGLDGAQLEAQIEVAEAEVVAARAALAQVKAGVPRETLDRALAQLAQAEAAQRAAQSAWEDAQQRQENPQELDLAITAARARVAVLEGRAAQAAALANSAQAGRELADQIEEMVEDFEPFNVSVGEGEVRVKLPADVRLKAEQQQALSTYTAWEAWTGLDRADMALEGARNYLAELERQRANPLALEAAANASEAYYEIATAAVAIAQAQVDGLEIGATEEQIAAAEAQVELARSALDLLEVQAGKLTLAAPISGLVLERPVHVGELAVPGAPLMTLADLDNLTMTVFVPEDQVGKVQIGQPVSVTVDAYPNRVFAGIVTYIASQAEFTPKNVQTREERVNMVFAVKVQLPNQDHALKPGMPADAVIITDD